MKYITFKGNIEAGYICNDITTYSENPIRTSINKYLEVLKEPSKKELRLLIKLVPFAHSLQGIPIDDLNIKTINT